AIVLALLHVLAKIYRPAETILGVLPDMPGYNDVGRSDKATEIPGVIICRFEAPLLFFNAERFKNRLLLLVDKATSRPRWFVLSAEANPARHHRRSCNRRVVRGLKKPQCSVGYRPAEALYAQIRCAA